MFLEDCIIIENSSLGGNNFLLKVKSERCVPAAKAGQFFMLKCKNGINILRRPISLHFADKEKNILEFYFEAKGAGTKEFSELKSGDTINIQGPLGNGFSTDVFNENILIIGGGMGLAPMKYLIDQLPKNNKITFIAGGRSFIHTKILNNFDLEKIQTYVTTDDGSHGKEGNVVDILEELLAKEKFDRVLTCGPHKMMEAIVAVTHRENIKTEISLEERMACGVKACVGCSIKTKVGMKKVCHDGPVFDSKILY